MVMNHYRTASGRGGMVMNHYDSAFNRHPNPVRGCAESVNWNLKGAYLSYGRLLHGWALVAQGQAEEGLDQMRQSLTAYEATGAAIWRPYLLALLAEGYGQVGAADEGLRVLAEALATVQHTGERVWEAEL